MGMSLDGLSFRTIPSLHRPCHPRSPQGSHHGYFPSPVLPWALLMVEHLREFDEVLKYINDLSMTIDLDSTLVRAEVLFYRFQGTVEIIERKNAENKREGKDVEGPIISDELRGLLKKDYPKE
jgi:hypothetical protein